MDIVAATEHDLPAVERLYRDVADEMNGAPHDVWWDFGVHPTHEGLLEAAHSGNLFVATAQAPEEQLFDDGPECEAGRPVAGLGCKPSVLGAFVLDARQGADYSLAPWLVDAPSGRVAVIHLLAAAPGARGRCCALPLGRRARAVHGLSASTYSTITPLRFRHIAVRDLPILASSILRSGADCGIPRISWSSTCARRMRSDDALSIASLNP